MSLDHFVFAGLLARRLKIFHHHRLRVRVIAARFLEFRFLRGELSYDLSIGICRRSKVILADDCATGAGAGAGRHAGFAAAGLTGGVAGRIGPACLRHRANH